MGHTPVDGDTVEPRQEPAKRRYGYNKFTLFALILLVPVAGLMIAFFEQRRAHQAGDEEATRAIRRAMLLGVVGLVALWAALPAGC
jgi:hypothetical protein